MVTRIRSSFLCALAVAVLFAVPFSTAHADDATKAQAVIVDQVDAAVFNKMVADGINFLKSQQEELDRADGGFTNAPSPGINTLVTTALLRHGISPDDKVVKKSLAGIVKLAKDDGGIYAEGSIHRNYETCLAVMCLVEANKDKRYNDLLAKADKFIKGLQWDEEEGTSREDMAYGGAGYGKHKRPDMSNTAFMIEALRANGNPEDDQHVQKALEFLNRAQNLESDKNTAPFAAKAAKEDRGGFAYTPAAGGQSQAGIRANGGLRSYGSMTYAGLKSFLFAGVDKDDERVVAAVDWISKNFTLERNPGMPDFNKAAGLYYYYHMFAKALDALGEDVFVDSDKVPHNWRADLVNELKKRQQKNGSWINVDNERWLENDGALVTGYALLSLSYCDPDSK